MHVWVEQKSPLPLLPVLPVLPVFDVLEAAPVLPLFAEFVATPAFPLFPVLVDEHAESPAMARTISSTKACRAASVRDLRVNGFILLAT
jgi:hypothetical protein